MGTNPVFTLSNKILAFLIYSLFQFIRHDGVLSIWKCPIAIL